MSGLERLRIAFALATGIAVGLVLGAVRWSPVDAHHADDHAGTRDVTDDAAPSDDEAESESVPSFSGEVVMYDQPRLMRQAIERLVPQKPGRTDLYAITFGGDGSEDVFRNEAEYAAKVLSQRFDAAGHVLTLVNNPATVETTPLATWTNLEAALDALATKMDPDEDILLLFLTSHGSEGHQLYVDLDPLPLDQIGADDLATMLAARPFRWKVIVVSACYSGGFVPKLANATSLVITAARADRTSFGCGSDSAITWFGKAFFAEGLNQSDSFHGAFDLARSLIGDWETREHETPSEPQIATTPLIEAKLKTWRQGIRLGPPVPFATPGGGATHRG